MSMAASDQISVGYAVPRWSPAWAVPEVRVPESEVHDQAIEYLRGVLLAWVLRTGLDAKVYRNLGIRWVPSEPRAGFDPDLCLVTPAPPESEGILSLKLWQAGHEAPKLAIEIVSQGHPYKDYVDTPDRCAACGVEELWIYDPCRYGRRAHGGPHLLQVWRRSDGGFERRHAGAGPAYSQLLGAWLSPAASRKPDEALLRVSDERDARSYWPTLSEQERQRSERERQAAEQERDTLAREVAELRKRLKRQEG